MLEGSALVRTSTRLTAAIRSPPRCDWLRLAAGRDGTAALTLDDLLGNELAGVDLGLATLADVPEPAAVAIPDVVAEPRPGTVRLSEPALSDPCPPCQPSAPGDVLEAQITEAPAAFGPSDVERAQQALVEHCERRADRVALLDPPGSAGPLDMAGLRDWRYRFDSTYAALYAPWIEVIDPLAADLKRVPPQRGTSLGLVAATDARSGPVDRAGEPPAGVGVRPGRGHRRGRATGSSTSSA